MPLQVRKNSESEWELPKRNGLVLKRNDIVEILLAILIVDMKLFIRLFARIDCKYGSF